MSGRCALLRHPLPPKRIDPAWQINDNMEPTVTLRNISRKLTEVIFSLALKSHLSRSLLTLLKAEIESVQSTP